MLGNRALRREQMPAMLIAKDYRLGAEIGVYCGEHAELLLANWPGTLWLVDPWRHQPLSVYNDQSNHSDEDFEKCIMPEAMNRLARFGNRARVLRSFSVDAAADFRDSEFDFVYLDANHSRAAVLADLRAWTPKVRSGGMVAGHDYIDYNREDGMGLGVPSALAEFSLGRSIELHVAFDETWPTWYFMKEEHSA